MGVDTTRASIARVYDATLGGKDNYEVDRFVRDKVAEVAPRQSDVARMNRRWLHRVVRYLAGAAGIEQFLDIGAGLPTVGNTHEIAQQQNPTARVVYVDNDPVCNIHGRVLLERNEFTHFVPADLTAPETLLAHSEVTQHLDLTRPLALILCGILHHVDDDLDPAGIMRRYIDALPAGSYVAITHFYDPADGGEAHEMAIELQRRFTEMGLGSGWYSHPGADRLLLRRSGPDRARSGRARRLVADGARAAAAADRGTPAARRPRLQAQRTRQRDTSSTPLTPLQRGRRSSDHSNLSPRVGAHTP
ncbi:SAM-dependent methyltransferase [Nocardia asiatica]